MWLIEHCIYAYNEKQKRLAFEVYVTDRLKAINDSVAKTLGGATVKQRYIELVERMKEKPAPEYTAEQVITSISDKLERIGNHESIRVSGEANAGFK